MSNNYPFTRSTAGSTIVVSGQPGMLIEVSRLVLAWGGAVQIDFEDGSTSAADILGPWSFTASGSLTLEQDEHTPPIMRTENAGEDLVIRTDAAVTVSGEVWANYVNVGPDW